MHVCKLLLEFRLSVNRIMDMSGFFRAGAMATWKRVAIWTIWRGLWKVRQANQMRGGVKCVCLCELWHVVDLWLWDVLFVCMLYYLYHWEISQRRAAETDNRIIVGHFYLLSSHRYFSVIGRWVLDPSISHCKPGLSLEGMFLFLLPLPCSGGAIEELHVATQGSEHLYLQVGDGFGRGCQGGCGHGAIE